MPLNSDIKVVYSPFAIVFTDKNQTIKVFYEKDNEFIFSVLQKNIGIKLMGNCSAEEQRGFYKYFGIFILGLVILWNSGTFCWLIYNRNEFLSYFYIYKGNEFIKTEKKQQTTKFLNINTPSDNLLKAYNFYKQACTLYPKQNEEIYDYIISYATLHENENDFKNFSDFKYKLYLKK